MKTLMMRALSELPARHGLNYLGLLLGIGLGLYLVQLFLRHDFMMVDWGFLPLVFLSLMLFLLLLAFNWWLFNNLLSFLGLQPAKAIALHFDQLQLWQQFLMYWALFALLLLASLMSFMAIF